MKRYDVVINGVQTTLLLNDSDAAARGLTAAEVSAPVQDKAKAPANKSRKPANKRAEAAAAAFGPKSDDA